MAEADKDGRAARIVSDLVTRTFGETEWKRPCYATLATNPCRMGGPDDIHVHVCQLPAGHAEGGMGGQPSAHRDSELLWTTATPDTYWRASAPSPQCALYDHPEDGICTCGHDDARRTT